MSHTYDYNRIPDETARKAKALHDIEFWLGKQYEAMNKVIKDEIAKGTTRENLRFNINMFLGIQGYPVEVWLDHLGAKPAIPPATEQIPNSAPNVADAQANSVKPG